MESHLHRGKWALVVGIGLLCSIGAQGGNALGTGFTYQGQIVQSGVAPNGTCDFQFTLFGSVSGSDQIGSMQEVSGVPVNNGIFTVQLNAGGQFGANAFGGSDRWLEIAARCPSNVGQFTAPFAPRQQLTGAPYALYAPAAGVAGDVSCSGCVGSSDIASGAVTSAAVAANAVGGSQLADGAVTSAKIADGTIQGVDLAAGAIGTNQIAAAAVT
jgi:hypothetical protein